MLHSSQGNNPVLLGRRERPNSRPTPPTFPFMYQERRQARAAMANTRQEELRGLVKERHRVRRAGTDAALASRPPPTSGSLHNDHHMGPSAREVAEEGQAVITYCSGPAEPVPSLRLLAEKKAEEVNAPSCLVTAGASTSLVYC